MILKKLAECINDISNSAILEAKNSKDDKYKHAINFFKNGKLPDGSKWGKPLNFRFGYLNPPIITNEKTKESADGIIYNATLSFSPGRGGGSGFTIDATASNQLFNMLGIDKYTIKSVSKAFLDFTKVKSRFINNMVLKYLKSKDTFLYLFAGWENRDVYTISDVMLKSIQYMNPVIDPTRRKWPSGRTEIWVPFRTDVIVNLKNKNK